MCSSDLDGVYLDVAAQVREVASLGVQIGVVVGGGNIFRGLQGSEKGIERVTGDHMGMLATVINSMALQDALEKQGVPTRVQSAITMSQVAEPFIRRRAVRHLEKKRVVIFGGGRERVGTVIVREEFSVARQSDSV